MTVWRLTCVPWNNCISLWGHNFLTYLHYIHSLEIILVHYLTKSNVKYMYINLLCCIKCLSAKKKLRLGSYMSVFPSACWISKISGMTIKLFICIYKHFFHQQIGLKFKKETAEVQHLECGFVWCWNLDTWESRLEIPRGFWNTVLDKDGENRWDPSCEKWRGIVISQREAECSTINKRKKG